MIRKYHNHKPQTTPWHCKEEPLNHHETPGRQIKQTISSVDSSVDNFGRHEDLSTRKSDNSPRPLGH